MFDFLNKPKEEIELEATLLDSLISNLTFHAWFEIGAQLGELYPLVNHITFNMDGDHINWQMNPYVISEINPKSKKIFRVEHKYTERGSAIMISYSRSRFIQYLRSELISITDYPEVSTQYLEFLYEVMTKAFNIFYDVEKYKVKRDQILLNAKLMRIISNSITFIERKSFLLEQHLTYNKRIQYRNSYSYAGFELLQYITYHCNHILQMYHITETSIDFSPCPLQYHIAADLKPVMDTALAMIHIQEENGCRIYDIDFYFKRIWRAIFQNKDMKHDNFQRDMIIAIFNLYLHELGHLLQAEKIDHIFFHKNDYLQASVFVTKISLGDTDKSGFSEERNRHEENAERFALNAVHYIINQPEQEFFTENIHCIADKWNYSLKNTDHEIWMEQTLPIHSRKFKKYLKSV